MKVKRINIDFDKRQICRCGKKQFNLTPLILILENGTETNVRSTKGSRDKTETNVLHHEIRKNTKRRQTKTTSLIQTDGTWSLWFQRDNLL